MNNRLACLAVVVQIMCLPACALITVSRDTTWGPDTVPVTDNVRVNNGVTLRIEPGSRLVFNSGYYLEIQGRLLAAGTPADSISFDVASGYDSYWNGIRFIKTPWTNDTSKLSYCVIEGCGPNYFNPGAVAIDSFSKVVIAHSTIRNNGGSGSFEGGGLRLRKANPQIVNSRFIGNSANGSMSHGGAIYCLASDPVIVNTLFSGNSSTGSAAGGAAMYLSMSSPTIVNCTFSKNNGSGAASFGGGIYCNYQSSPRVINTIIWGNLDDQIPLFDTSCAPVFRNCAIQEGSYLAPRSRAVFDQCIALDPKFFNDTIGDFTLRSNSPCINAGSADTAGLGLPLFDLADAPRLAGDRIDIGAYEFQGVVGVARAERPNQFAVTPGRVSVSAVDVFDLRGKQIRREAASGNPGGLLIYTRKIGGEKRVERRMKAW